MSEEQIAEVVDDAIVVEAEAEEHQEATPVDPPVREWSDEDAEEARFLGWKDPDEWKGDLPAGYIDDPRRYVERAENSKPFRAVKQRLEEQEAKSAEALRKLEAINERALTMQREKYERDMEQIAASQRQAVENMDTDTFDRLEKRRQGMKAPEAPAEVQNAEQERLKQAVSEYSATDNGKWVTNPVMQQQGAQIVDAGMRSGALMPGAPAEAQFAYAEAEMRKMYPAMFDAPKPAAKPQPQRVDGGGLAGGAAKAGAFTKLPAEAKSAFKKFVGEGLFKDDEEGRKEYADTYNAA